VTNYIYPFFQPRFSLICPPFMLDKWPYNARRLHSPVLGHFRTGLWREHLDQRGRKL